MNPQLASHFKKHGLNPNTYVSTVTDGLRDNPYVVLIEEAVPRYLVINSTICEYFDSFSDALEYLNTGVIKEKDETVSTFTLKPYLENCDIRFASPIKCLGLKDGLLVVTLPINLPTEEAVRAQRNMRAALQDATRKGIITDIQFIVLPEGANILKLESVV